MKPTDVLIVGGGIAGLAAARTLAADGRSVTVVERTPTWAPVGAGIVLARNAMRVLDDLGTGDAVRARGRALPAAAIADAAGRPLLDMGGTAELLAVPRAALHEALLDGLTATVHLGTTVEALHHDPDVVTATLSDGTVHRAGILVGADGIRSRVRELLRGDDGPAVTSTGHQVWRLVTEDHLGLDRALEQWGRGRRAGLIPMPEGRIYAFLVEDDVATAAEAGEDTVAALQQRFAEFGGPAGALLRGLSPQASPLLHDMEELDRVDFGRGRISLIGDAAHAMTPNLGQGAAQALEDVPALAVALRTGDPIDLAERIDRLRRGRATAVKQRSARLGQIGQWSSRPATALRTALVRATPAAAARRAARAVTAHDPLALEVTS